MNNDLISRAALLGGYNVRKVTEYDESGCGIDYKAVPLGVIAAAPAVDAAPKWISVEDRLPEKRQWVLVVGEFVPEGGWFVPLTAEFSRDSWRIKDDAYSYPEDLHIKVTHWMPLPPPPES